MNWRSQVLTIGGIFQRFLAAKYELYERRTPLNVVKQDEQIDTFCNAAIHWGCNFPSSWKKFGMISALLPDNSWLSNHLRWPVQIIIVQPDLLWHVASVQSVSDKI